MGDFSCLLKENIRDYLMTDEFQLSVTYIPDNVDGFS